jgi:hypothetical protein
MVNLNKKLILSILMVIYFFRPLNGVAASFDFNQNKKFIEESLSPLNPYTFLSNKVILKRILMDQMREIRRSLIEKIIDIKNERKLQLSDCDLVGRIDLENIFLDEQNKIKDLFQDNQLTIDRLNQFASELFPKEELNDYQTYLEESHIILYKKLRNDIERHFPLNWEKKLMKKAIEESQQHFVSAQSEITEQNFFKQLKKHFSTDNCTSP